jgi:hypothetical protein
MPTRTKEEEEEEVGEVVEEGAVVEEEEQVPWELERVPKAAGMVVVLRTEKMTGHAFAPKKYK